jgi:hypothetical protein
MRRSLAMRTTNWCCYCCCCFDFVLTDYACLKDIGLGVFDKYLIPFAKQVAAGGKPVNTINVNGY